jgi:hypothetical protein
MLSYRDTESGEMNVTLLLTLLPADKLAKALGNPLPGLFKNRRRLMTLPTIRRQTPRYLGRSLLDNSFRGYGGFSG